MNFCFSDEPGEILVPLTPLPSGDFVKVRNRWFLHPSTDAVESLELGDEYSSRTVLDDTPLFRALGLHRPVVGALSGLNVLLVKDGILVDSYLEEGDDLMGTAFFSAGDLKVSADGFRLMRDQAFEDYRSSLRELFLKNKVTQAELARLLKTKT